jgi:hypothetical protein
MTSAPASGAQLRLEFTHAQEPGVQISCYSVGSYASTASAGDTPIMRCFLSSGAGTGGMELPTGKYHSQRGGLEIVCDAGGLDDRTCNISRTQVTQEVAGPLNFMTDCAVLIPKDLRCAGGEPVVDSLQLADARVSDSALLRDSIGTAAGASRSSAPEAEDNMTCLRTMVMRPVPITIFTSGPTALPM